MDLQTAQRDLAAANVGGTPGVLVSGLAWLAAGLVLAEAGPRPAFLTLFVGGMLIVPLAAFIARALGAPRLRPGNPLTRLGFEGTVTLFAGLLIGWIALERAPALAFPAVAAAIGARYFIFRTLYGDGLWWGLGGALLGSATVAALRSDAFNLPLVVGLIELAFAALLFARRRRAAG